MRPQIFDLSHFLFSINREIRNNIVLKSIYKALFRTYQNNFKIFFWSQMFFMSVYIINIKNHLGLEKIFLKMVQV